VKHQSSIKLYDDLCARLLSNGLARQSTNRSGAVPTIANNATRVALYQAQVRSLAFKWDDYIQGLRVTQVNVILAGPTDGPLAVNAEDIEKMLPAPTGWAVSTSARSRRG